MQSLLSWILQAPNLITLFLNIGGPVPARISIRGRCNYKRMVKEMHVSSFEDKGKKCEWPLETGRGKGIDSPLEH